MPRVVIATEVNFVDQRLKPVIDRLNADRELLNAFLHFSEERGADLALMLQRLQYAWWRPKPQYAPFFAVTLLEFGLLHDLLPWPEARPPAGIPLASPAKAKRPRRR